MPDGTDVTASAPANTDNSGQVGTGAENKNQDAEVTRLKNLEEQIDKFAKLEESNRALEQQIKTAQAEALRWQSSYRGLQANTTSSLQEAAKIRQQAAEQSRIMEEISANRQELSQIRDNLSFLASKLVDEDTAREFSFRQREAQAKIAEEQARARIAQLTAQVQQPQPQPQQQQPIVDIDLQRRQFMDYYFPNSGIDHNNSSIDWGEGASNTQEAFRRFTTSVMKIRNDQTTPAKEEGSQSEAQALLAQIRREREALEATRSKSEEEIKEAARREVEQRLRSTGADAGNSGITTDSTRRVATRLNEVDESKLMIGEPSARKKAAKTMEEELRSVREQLIGQYK